MIIPFISVIVPLYNKGPYIKRAIDSILAQTFQDYEVIVVDDGSTDNGAQMVKEYGDQHIRLIQQENAGVSSARNIGVHKALSEYVAFLDADDYWTPAHLETLIRLIKLYPDAGIYSTAYNFVKLDGSFVWPKYREIPPPPWEGKIPSYFKFAALTDLALSTSSLAIPKAIFWEMEGFRVGLNMYEDSELWAKIALKYPVVFSWQVGSICDAYALNRLSNRLVNIEHPFVNYFERSINIEQLDPNLKNDLIEYIAYLKIQDADYCLMRGEPHHAKKILKGCETNLLYKKKFIRTVLSCLPKSMFFSLWRMKRIIGRLIFKKAFSEDPWFK